MFKCLVIIQYMHVQSVLQKEDSFVTSVGHTNTIQFLKKSIVVRFVHILTNLILPMILWVSVSTSIFR